MILPPNISQTKFLKALEEFKNIVGNDEVISVESDIEKYRDPNLPVKNQPEEAIPSAAVRPGSVEEIQAVLKVANEYKIPLWTISRGRNFGYGGPTAVVRGSVIVDLGRMNRIIELDEKHAYAVVEPGVSREMLWAEILKRGLKLWQDGPSSPWGSIVGSAADRGCGYGLFGEQANITCGMEVVLPDGDLVRTGMGAMSNSKTWQQYKWGNGPWMDGIFSQSNYGIITKLGVWLIPQPPSFRSAEVYVKNPEDLVPFIDTLRKLRMANVLENSISGAPNWGGYKKDGFGPGGGIFPPPSGMKNGWRGRLGFYGHKDVVEAKWQQTQEAFSHIPGVSFNTNLYHAPYDYTDWSSESKLAAGVISPGELPLEIWHGPDVHDRTFVSLVIPFDGESYRDLVQTVDGIMQEYGLRYVGGPFHGHTPRSLIVLISAVHGGTKGIPGRAAETPKVIEMMKKIVDVGHKKGWGEYRTATYMMDHVAETFDFNNHAMRRLQERIKDALDPNGILAPYRYGIRPKEGRN